MERDDQPATISRPSRSSVAPRPLQGPRTSSIPRSGRHFQILPGDLFIHASVKISASSDSSQTGPSAKLAQPVKILSGLACSETMLRQLADSLSISITRSSFSQLLLGLCETMNASKEGREGLNEAVRILLLDEVLAVWDFDPPASAAVLGKAFAVTQRHLSRAALRDEKQHRTTDIFPNAVW